ncbi:MAG: putative family ATPase [Frankiales bacterium]|nr:putative family ATPase [Frankiales bacterium]
MDTILGQFDLSDLHNDLGPYLYFRAHERRGDAHLVKRDLKHAVTRDVLPDRAVLVRTVDNGPCVDVLAEVDDTVVLLRTWKQAADVWVTAHDEPTARAVASEIEARAFKQPAQGRIELRFTSDDSSTRYVEVDVPTWTQVEGHYSPAVHTALNGLVAHRHSTAEARRLMLWHGEPGTGKTTAIRALLHAWQEWTEAVVVTDPESLLSSGKYLRRVMLDANDDHKWQVVVLEDAESLLHKTGGKGMAKLLNLCDGLLGQGLRCLFLITTNEPLQAVHPALVRPGRCLSRVEFDRLPASQAAGLLGRPVDRGMTLAEVMAAKPVTVVQEPVAVGQYL